MQSSIKRNAEQRFREAFHRLKNAQPIVLPVGSHVTQNNVAKEAGCDPSALRKSRYPELLNEIKAYAEVFQTCLPASTRKEAQKKRNVNRSIREAKRASDEQRDKLASQLLCANAMIVELSNKLADTQAKLESITPSAQRLQFPTKTP